MLYEVECCRIISNDAWRQYVLLTSSEVSASSREAIYARSPSAAMRGLAEMKLNDCRSMSWNVANRDSEINKLAETICYDGGMLAPEMRGSG